MKTAILTIEVPVPDETELKDAIALAELIERTALTEVPLDAMTQFSKAIIDGTPIKVYGRLTEVRIGDEVHSP
jgi:hypothetical protein